MTGVAQYSDAFNASEAKSENWLEAGWDNEEKSQDEDEDVVKVKLRPRKLDRTSSV
jgi:hypothetical protein